MQMNFFLCSQFSKFVTWQKSGNKTKFENVGLMKNYYGWKCKLKKVKYWINLSSNRIKIFAKMIMIILYKAHWKVVKNVYFIFAGCGIIEWTETLAFAIKCIIVYNQHSYK